MRALAQFVRTLVSAGSRYDGYIAGQEELSDDELTGLRVFERSQRLPPCALYRSRLSRLGLEPDHRRTLRMCVKGARITERSEDLGRKTPSLRNVTLSAPYGHDGRFPTLRAVLDSYRHGCRRRPISTRCFEAMTERLGWIYPTTRLSNSNFSRDAHRP